MPTLPQTEKQVTVSFRCPEQFRRKASSALKLQGVSVTEFCIRALSEKLGIPVPGEEPEPKKRRAS